MVASLILVCAVCRLNYAGFPVTPKHCPSCQVDWKTEKPGKWPFVIGRHDWAVLKALGIGVR